MSDFLGRLARRSIDASSSSVSLRPRLPSLFEPTLQGGPDPAPAPASRATHFERETDERAALVPPPPVYARRVDETHARPGDVRAENTDAHSAQNTRARPDAPRVDSTTEQTTPGQQQADDTTHAAFDPARMAESLVVDAARERQATEGAEASIEARAAQLAAMVARVESMASDENALRDAAAGRDAHAGGAERSAGAEGREGREGRVAARARRVVTPAAVVVRERAAPSPVENAKAGAVGSSDAGPSIVRVTIGRVEVRAVTSPAQRPAPEGQTRKAQGASALSLEDYLKQRNGGAR